MFNHLHRGVCDRYVNGMAVLVRTLHIDQYRYQYWWINLALCLVSLKVSVKSGIGPPLSVNKVSIIPMDTSRDETSLYSAIIFDPSLIHKPAEPMASETIVGICVCVFECVYVHVKHVLSCMCLCIQIKKFPRGRELEVFLKCMGTSMHACL